MARSEISVSIADLPAVKAELELLRASRDRWRDAAELLGEQVERVKALHWQVTYGGTSYCDGDGFLWPCETRRALDGD